jgi:RNA-splicing ligase RtcB
MGKCKLRGKDLSAIQYTSNKAKSLAIDLASRHFKHFTKQALLNLLQQVKNNPEAYAGDDILGGLAQEFIPLPELKPKEEIALLKVENHHNFAWKEVQGNGEEWIVHRKGATPAARGELGIIPGSMTAPGYLVRGKGAAAGLHSASYGAGRKLSRQKAKASFTGSELKKILSREGVTLIGGGVDEASGAYKNLEEVMASQQELVEVIGSFTPKIVRMDKS